MSKKKTWVTGPTKKWEKDGQLLKNLDRLANELRFAVRAKYDPKQDQKIADIVSRIVETAK